VDAVCPPLRFFHNRAHVTTSMHGGFGALALRHQPAAFPGGAVLSALEFAALAAVVDERRAIQNELSSHAAHKGTAFAGPPDSSTLKCSARQALQLEMKGPAGRR